MSSRSKFRAWIEAMRLHTLPVSVAGVLTSAGCAAYYDGFNIVPFTICMLFAIGAQIVSNFANEYFDYRNGLDRKGREGFRRGVTEGDITPGAMRNATFVLLGVVSALGCSLIVWGGWWLLPVGVAIALFALGYSAGPYPLSHHGLGEMAVVIFFGIVPVTLSTYVQSHEAGFSALTIWLSVAVGLMGANVLVVNNYRDREDDLKAGKKTLAVRWGAKAMERLYLANGIVAAVCIMAATLLTVNKFWQIGILIYVNLHYLTWQRMKQSEGSELNPILGKTAMLMLAMSVWVLMALIIK